MDSGLYSSSYSSIGYSELDFQPSLLPQDMQQHPQQQDAAPSEAEDAAIRASAVIEQQLQARQQQRKQEPIQHARQAQHAQQGQHSQQAQRERPQVPQLPRQIATQRRSVEHYNAPYSGPSIWGMYASKQRDVIRLLCAALTVALGLSIFWFMKMVFKQVVFTPEQQATWTLTRRMAANACMPMFVVVLLWSLKVFGCSHRC